MSKNPDEKETVDTEIRRERRDSVDRKWKEYPLKTYIEERKEQNLNQNHWKREKRVLTSFREFLQQTDIKYEIGLRDVTEEDVKSYIQQELVSDPNVNDTTSYHRLSFINRFYQKLVKNHAIRDNPVKEPISEFRADDSTDVGSPQRPFIPFNRMKKYVNWIDSPFTRAAVLPGLKHGIRTGELTNIDLRCLNIAHPVFEEIVDEHDVQIDPRIRDKPDSFLIYEKFNKGTEIPNADTPGPETSGEIRTKGNKRREKNGSVLPVDSELKTAFIEWLLVRPNTFHLEISPLFTNRVQSPDRVSYDVFAEHIWLRDYPDSVQRFSKEESLTECPDCGTPVREENRAAGGRTGRQYYCSHCQKTHWRTIHWEEGLPTAQKVTYHQFRHYFSDAHRVGKSEIHDGEIPDKIRKKRIRGDKKVSGDTDERVYEHKQHEDWEVDVRQPYLENIYKFGIYDDPIPAVGEGWNV